ncbi:thioredoxin-T-like [Schistocerca americana]|uniref:Thioredoxin 2-like protein n=1 Tax=Schistocerca gregaria TaxID=7010 RepID=A0A8E5JTB4_SCHGR|nr:thioredoxin-T-like [Schistocerca americana]XP_047112946.1 thioredoxin-T-like [Schistocerca piceifrons]XP_049786009.1 thioredoxin-T-like [Schistocerca cancellata]XP_049808806.1 thioredoxin-T-like [Schistocerca nitens]XP_049829949.1 thioredoxin-T-like [Schistocerca gregaria]XP_049964267.1 thioredoxin-T-like [Schistocerca serialis cubense]QVD39383.1 Thioredoxin 2-like protein [Schistocerca gregaria]
MVHIITGEDDLKARLADAGSNLVVIDFFADWCGPCKAIAPKFEELSQKYPDVVFLKVNVDDNESIAVTYDVKAMPTFVFIKDGKTLDSFAGANVDKLTQLLVQHK